MVTKKPKKVEELVYSKLEYNSAISTKRNILGIQACLLRAIQIMESYRELRKKELMYKIKAKNNLKEIKDKINKILEQVPRSQISKEFNQRTKEKEENKSAVLGIEAELADIQRKLEEMANK